MPTRSAPEDLQKAFSSALKATVHYTSDRGNESLISFLDPGQ